MIFKKIILSDFNADLQTHSINHGYQYLKQNLDPTNSKHELYLHYATGKFSH